MGRVYAVASAKGGVGKTTTTANLGATLARAGHDVVVVDADIGMANLAGLLGVTPDGATLHDVLADRASLESAVYDGPDGLAVVPGSRELEDYRDADPRELADVVADLREQYEYVILDTGAGLSHDTVLPLGLADEVLLVSTPYESALGDTDKTRDLVEQLDGTVAGLVLTRVSSETPDVDEVTVDLGVDVLGTIPDDPVVNDALVAGEPLSVYAPASEVAAAYRSLAAELTGESISTPSEAETEAEAEAGEAESETDTGKARPSESETQLAESGEEPGETPVESESEESDSVPDVETEHEAGEASAQAAEASAETGEGEAEGTDETESESEGVYSTPLVEEAEESGEAGESEAETAEAIGEAEEETEAEPETEEEEDTDENKGFFSRLFG